VLLKLRSVNWLCARRQAHFHCEVIVRSLPDSYNHTLLQQIKRFGIEKINSPGRLLFKSERCDHSLYRPRGQQELHLNWTFLFRSQTTTERQERTCEAECPSPVALHQTHAVPFSRFGGTRSPGNFTAMTTRISWLNNKDRPDFGCSRARVRTCQRSHDNRLIF
jgi:hypothetical protein